MFTLCRGRNRNDEYFHEIFQLSSFEFMCDDPGKISPGDGQRVDGHHSKKCRATYDRDRNQAVPVLELHCYSLTRLKSPARIDIIPTINPIKKIQLMYSVHLITGKGDEHNSAAFAIVI